jgi:hypothetical protein
MPKMACFSTASLDATPVFRLVNNVLRILAPILSPDPQNTMALASELFHIGNALRKLDPK